MKLEMENNSGWVIFPKEMSLVFFFLFPPEKKNLAFSKGKFCMCKNNVIHSNKENDNTTESKIFNKEKSNWAKDRIMYFGE